MKMATLQLGDDLAARLSEHVGPGDHVAVANPTDPDVLAAIVACGARYVDAGRDHRFRIDPGGWRAVLRDPRTKLAYLPSPDWPTATVPGRARFDEAAAAGVMVLADERRAGERLTWARVPGVPSAEIAARAGSAPVVVSEEWTWRDGFLVEGPLPQGLLESLGAILPALLVAISVGCRPAPTPQAPAAEPPRIDPVQAPVPAPVEPILPASVKREILVGGCNEACDGAEQSLHGFLRAALGSEGPDVVRPFVNTAILVHDGVEHGDRWAQLFMDRRLGERRTQIDNWLKEWLGWSDRLSDPADRAFDEGGITEVEKNQSRYVVLWRHPDLTEAEGARTGPIWRIVLQKRGLEWLVAEIDEHHGQ